VILTKEEIANAANVPSTGGSGPMPALRAVERATLERAARKIEAGETGTFALSDDAAKVLRVWAVEDARECWP